MVTLRTLFISLGLASALAAAPTPVKTTNPVQEMLEGELLTLLDPGVGLLELTPVRALPKIATPEKGTLSVKVLNHPERPQPYFSVRFALMADGKKLGEWPAYYRSKLYRDVWVVRSPARRGDSLDRVDMKLERRDVINVRTSLWNGKKPDAKFCLVQPLGSGSIVYDRYVKHTPVVFRGQVVDALIQIRALTVKLKVEVLQDGAPGDVVRMRNLQTRREIRGIVINEKNVKINL